MLQTPIHAALKDNNGISLSEFYGGLSPILGRIRKGNSAALGRFIHDTSAECPIFCAALAQKVENFERTLI